MDKKTEAIKLRKLGWSYNKISKKLDTPKGTISYWFKGLIFSEKIKEKNIQNSKIKWAANLTKYNKNRSVVARARWASVQAEANNNAPGLAKDPLFLAGVMLYWAEGYKKGNWNVIFTNADPEMNKIMMHFFVNVCCVPKEKIKCKIQVHSLTQVEKSLSFWSKCIGLPKSNFLKTTVQKHVTKNANYNPLVYGTLQIRINDVLLVNKIKGWIIWATKLSGYGSIG